MENILKIVSKLSGYSSRNIIVYQSSWDIHQYYEICWCTASESEFVSRLDAEMLPIGWYETQSWDLINATLSYKTIRDLLLDIDASGNKISISTVMCNDEYKTYIYNWELQYISDAIFIEDIDEYNKQKEEEERIRLEELRQNTIKNTVKDMLVTLNKEKINHIINYNKKILDHIFFIKKSEWKQVPYFIHSDSLYTYRERLVNIALDKLNYTDIKQIYKEIKKDDYTTLDSFFPEKIVFTDEQVAILEQALETRAVSEEVIEIINLYFNKTGVSKRLVFDWGISMSSITKLIHQCLYAQEKYMWLRVKVGERYNLLFWELLYTGTNTQPITHFEIPTNLSKTRYENSIKKKLKDGEGIKDIIKKYKDMQTIVDEDMARQKIEEIYSFSEVEDVLHDWNELCVYTKPMYISQYYTAEQQTQDMLIGKFVIKINIRNWWLSIFKSPEKRNWWQAPHIFQDGRFCTGDFNNIMAEASRKLDYSALIYYILEHLRTYNAGSPVENIQSYLSNISSELFKLEWEWYPITRPLTGFSLTRDWNNFSS